MKRSAAAAAGCGGELAIGSPVTCASITGAERHTWTGRTTVDGERLLTQFHAEGDSTQARVTGADGASCFLGPYHSECELATAGPFTVQVYLYHKEGQASYGLGIESRDAPSGCTTLDPATFSVTATPISAALARGDAGDCYRFTGTAGTRLDVQTTDRPAAEGGTSDVRGTLENAAGEQICGFQFGGGTCELPADGTYTAFLADNYGGAVDYTLRFVRVDRPIGCEPLRQGAYGDLAADQIAGGTVAADGFRCYTVTATAGLKTVRTSDGGQVDWELTGPAGRVCGEWENYGLCDVPAAGDYVLWLRNDDWESRNYRATFLDLAGTGGCEPAIGTGWDQPTVRFTAATPLQAHCRPFTAAAGERIVEYVSGGLAWITDRTGARICDGQDYEQDGCVLPGSGPYRLVMLSDEGENSYQVRRLSDPAGCPVINPGGYGTGPAGAPSGNRCRVLDVPAAGRHLVRVLDDENYEPHAQIYDTEGTKVCGSGYLCDFPSAGRYTLIVGGGQGLYESEYATVFTSPRAAGCLPAGDQGLSTGAIRSTFTVAGEVDCLELPGSAGATIDVLTPPRASGVARPEWSLINGDGVNLCATNDCVLTGPAPYRILLTAPENSATGAYALVVQRFDRVDGCPVLPQGAFGDTTGVTTNFSADRFASCWSIPANQHSTAEVFTFAPVSGTGWAGLAIRDEAGQAVCGGSYYASSQVMRCTLQSGKPYTAVMTASASDFQYRLSRKDASTTGARCERPANTVLGGPSLSGVLRADDDVRCYRVTAAAADSYWIGVRSTDFAARYWITDAAGEDHCAGLVVPCRVSGSTSYQVVVWSSKDGVSVPYRLDTWHLGSAGQPPAQCPAVAAAPKFGPLTGTLTEQRTAVCVAVPVNNYSDFTVDVTNTAGGDVTPEPYFFHTYSGTNVGICSYAQGGRGCQVSMPYPRRSGTALFVLAPKADTANLPFRAEVLCEEETCTAPYALGTVAPTSAPNGGPVTLTLRGSGFSAGDTVTLTRTGAAAIPATVKSATGEVMTVTADLTGVAPAAWDVVARAAEGHPTVTLTGGLLVTAAPLKKVKAPSISGTVRVGSTVKAVAGVFTPAAGSYAYQWTANGVAIKGATGSAYTVPVAQRGKRLGVTVTAKRAGRANTPAVSAAVVVGYGIAPKAAKKPGITGSVKAGKKVTVSVGAWSPRADSYRYEWRVNGKVVARTATLKIKKSWAGKKVTVTVVAKRTGHHDGRATSGAVKIKR